MKAISIRNRASLVGLMLLVLLFNPGWAAKPDDGKKIDLSGKWTYALDSADVGVKEKWYNSVVGKDIMLPGTLDAAGAGAVNTLLPKLEKPQVLHLTRKYSYVGPAWYLREFVVPEGLAGKELLLNLERVLWTSQVWIDGKPQGMSNSLVTPHRYTIAALSPGKHSIAIRIDNRKQYDISYNDMAHAYTNETQVMWNGILGKMSLEPLEQVRIIDLNIYPDLERKGVRVVVTVENKGAAQEKGTLTLSASLKGKAVKPFSQPIVAGLKANQVECFYPLGAEMKLWDEFNPNVYTLHVALNTAKSSSVKSATFGMRKLTAEGRDLKINGARLFLRGTLECSIFPLTGTPPTSKEGWHRVFDSAKRYGLNHLRFHSWCPPQAAFEVADEMGFYLQVELPLWSLNVGKDSATTGFLKKEAVRIAGEYGNHPSFCLWSIGNELEGDVSVLTSLVAMLKAKDSRHLYTSTTFSFQKGLGDKPLDCDDYFVSQWTKNGWIRGQGIFNSEAPAFNKSYGSALKDINVPVISHEIGQYSVYPNIKEIEKYKGTLIPLNFMAVKEDLIKRGLLDKAGDFLYNSGRLAALLYKEEIERALKTKEFSGFQLLDLHDFPGQGTALVGLLDAFWDSKGVISADEFRSFCGPVVPLADFPKAVYLNSERFVADAGISNFSGKTIPECSLIWTLSGSKNEIVAKGESLVGPLAIGYSSGLGKISVPLAKVTKAQKLVLKVAIKGTSYRNSWSIWVYPSELKVNEGSVLVTSDITTAEKGLAEGRKVLFCPNPKAVKGIEGKFVPVFWSPVHFPKQAGSMGVLCNPSDPSLAGFPTDSYTSWQWWDLNKNSTPVVLDSISKVKPLVSIIDNFVTNRRLATVFEAKVASGKLLFSSVDLVTDIDNRPVAKQLLFSLLSYMNGTRFNPENSIPVDDIRSLILIGR